MCDDPPIDTLNDNIDDEIPWHYISALEFLLDNKYYNQIVKVLLNKKKINARKLLKIKDKFYGKYVFNDESYIGEYFDYRLNIENISKVSREGNNIDAIFNKVTHLYGKKKIFIGVHSAVVDLILKKKGLSEIIKLNFNKIKEVSNNGVEIFRDSDGIIIVITQGKPDNQVDEKFTETEVKRRLNCLLKLKREQPEECGAPCRSREKAGKSCKIKTYRGNCHFHR